ncbi:MAG: uroporphyrinogen decarboxylase [Treponema sp.]|jgi:uroporphyrinogen decarboxylase|nr:uroporphyrinogen decarboxylase [Treponema sp.]
MSKRELVLKTFRNEKPERTPVGFWFHYAKDELVDGFENPEVFEANIAGHRKFYTDFQPDLVKIMTDGYFIYPNKLFMEAKTLDDLRKVQPIGENHEWIERQVGFAKTIRGIFGDEVLSFYNIFAPATLFKFGNHGEKNAAKLFTDFAVEDAAALARALRVVAGDLAILAQRVISEAKISGLYYSVHDVADSRFSDALRLSVNAPADRVLLDAANETGAASETGALNILHICGYEGQRNQLSHYVDYPAQIINWATTVEKVSLGQGKRLFGGRPVIGGFDSTVNGVLYKGGKAEIEAETGRLLREAGTTGVVLGADCTIPRDIKLDHLRWVRDAAAAFKD